MIDYFRWKFGKINEQEYYERKARSLLTEHERLRVKRILVKERLDSLITLRNK